MPKLGKKKYKYNKEGKAAYARDLMKKLKKKRKASPRMQGDDFNDYVIGSE